MNGKSLRIFEVDGQRMTFDTASFNHLFHTIARQTGKSVGAYEEEVGRAVYVGPDAVHSWRNGVSGPGDLEKIEALAAFWGIRRETLLTKAKNEEKEGERTVKIRTGVKVDELKILCIEREFEAERRIYAAIIEFLEDYLATDRFEGYRRSIEESISLPSEIAFLADESSIIDYEEELFYTFKCKKLQAVYLVARKEEFDLYDRLAYSELLAYIDTTLADLVDAPPKEGHSTYDDYTDALRRLREIVHGEIVDEEIFDVEEYALTSSD